MAIAPATLATLTPFLGAPRPVIDTLATYGVELHYATDAVIFLARSEPRGWYVVISGKVRVVRGSGTRQHVVHTEGPGGTLGEVPLFGGGTHPATGIAAEPTRCALFTLPALRAAMAANDAVALILLQRLALRVRGLVDRLDERSASNVEARLTEFLIGRRSASRFGVFTLGMTQQQLAEELGTVREVVSRGLSSLCRSGFVESMGGGRYRLRDPVR